jgi:hypothetical protein
LNTPPKTAPKSKPAATSPAGPTPLDQTRRSIVNEVFAGRLRPTLGHVHEPRRWTYEGRPVDNAHWLEAIRLLLNDRAHMLTLADLIDLNDDLEHDA